MTELRKFAAGKKLVDTRLVEDPDQLKTYLAGIDENSGVYVVALWNEVPNDGSSVTALIGGDPVGQAQVVTSELADGAIPGFATYFVIIPEGQVLGVLRVVDNIPGLPALKSYLSTFLASSTNAVVTKQMGHEVQIVGYKDPAGTLHKSLYPRFALSLLRLMDQAAFIKANATKVRKVIRTRLLDVVANPKDLKAWQTFIGFLGLAKHAAPKTEMRVRYEVDVKATKAEISAIVEQFADDVEVGTDDVGFLFTGDTEIHWLSNSIARSEFALNVQSENGVFATKALAKELGPMKTKLLAATK
ncbi:MAG: hypothetical protein IAE66_06320 [Xanthomonadaceae bacterium]|nr:hypothetical protein [Xanthomonadaceae bacterium]